MSQPLVTCSCCGGKGKRHLPTKLREAFAVAEGLYKKIGKFNVSQFAEASGKLRVHAAHHRIKRMVKLGALKRSGSVAPAVYVVS